jgi:hypothetical protein
VSFSTGSGKWLASKCIGGRRYIIGLYDSEDGAVDAVDRFNSEEHRAVIDGMLAGEYESSEGVTPAVKAVKAYIKEHVTGNTASLDKVPRSWHAYMYTCIHVSIHVSIRCTSCTTVVPDERADSFHDV